MRPENIFNLGDGYAAVDDEDQIDESDEIDGKLNMTKFQEIVLLSTILNEKSYVELGQ